MNCKVPKKENKATLEWKPRIPNRGEPLNFDHFEIWISNGSSKVTLFFEDKHENLLVLKIDGSSDLVYGAALNRVPDKSLEEFKEAWINAKLDYVSAKPSKREENYDVKVGNKKIEFKSQKEIFFNYGAPNEMLAYKARRSGFDLSEIAEKTGLHVSMVSKQIKGERDITREQAFLYSKCFGCDPADILFAVPRVPIWSTVNFLEFTNANLPFNPGELIATQDQKEYVICPRNIYRPDVKAVKVKSPGSYLDGMVLFYYATSDVKQDCIGRLSIIGEDDDGFDDLMKELRFGETQRYFIGILEQAKGKTTLINPDPFAYAALETQGTVIIKNVTPTFASPIVGMIHPDKIIVDQHAKKLFRANDHVYSTQRQIEEQYKKRSQILDMQSKLEKENKKLRDELNIKMKEAKKELAKLTYKVEAREKLNSGFGINLFGVPGKVRNTKGGLLDLEKPKQKKKRA